MTMQRAPDMAVDFDEIRAADQGLELREIATMYEGSTDDDVQTLENRGLIGSLAGRGGERAHSFGMTSWHR